MKIEKTKEIGFCFGVKRALDLLEKAAQQYGRLETLGSVVHNEEVLRKLEQKGIRAAAEVDDITCATVAISSHGVSPAVEQTLREKGLAIVDTTCPFVRRAQLAARNLAEAGFFVVVFGEAKHPEVKGILGYAPGSSMATLDAGELKSLSKTPGGLPAAAKEGLPRKLGILSQTTQVPENFLGFVKGVMDFALVPDGEIRVVDTLCHGTRQRQEAASELAAGVDLMLVVGGKSSANTRRLYELCAGLTETHLIGTAADIDPAWLKGKESIGITSGTSTSQQTVDEVEERVNQLEGKG